ncbi:MAG: peptidoglycan editing factor PgeF [Sulfobacillus sp.]
MNTAAIHLPAGEPLTLCWHQGVALLQPPSWADDGVVAAFSTRLGGVSDGAYRAMNPSLSSGDDPVKVAENRRRLLSAVGAPDWPVAAIHQVHGARVAVVAQAPAAGWPVHALVQADAQVTQLAGVVLSVVVADCVPILLRAKKRQGIGVVHAGWRGTAAGVTEAAVEELCRLCACRPDEIEAAIGPAIGPECYPVGPEVEREILKNHAWALAETADGRVDLVSLQAEILRRQGLKPASIMASRLCTRCAEQLLFSYRRDGQASGRIAALIGLQKQE